MKPRPQTQPSVSSEAIQAETAKILASSLFAESERLRRFLLFTVDLTLQGGGSQIKEYLIGIEVFGREQSFDPASDPIVRVHAGRLRSKLEKYYAEEGREDRLIVAYPKGSYVPTFKLREEPAPALRLGLGRRWQAAAIALAALAVYWAWWVPRTKRVQGGPPSIAVIPFVDMSETKDQDFFAEGITEEIIAALARMEGLRVVARTSTFEFKGKSQDIRKIGAQLNVATVLEGSVRKAGGALRVMAQLINVADGYHLWSETYDRESKDVLAIQEEIARAVANALHIRLASGQKQRLVKRYTDNPEAYRLYLQGRYHFHKPGIADQKMAIQYFEQALTLDPRYAPALAGMADAYFRLARRDGMPSTEAIGKARRAARQALEIDESLGEAHGSLAHILFAYDWDHEASEKEYRRALELNPNNPIALRDYAFYLLFTGRPDESLVQIQRALQLDPLSSDAGHGMARIYMGRREFANAVSQCQRVLARDPTNHGVYVLMGLSLAALQSYPESVAALEKACALSGREPHSLSGLGYALGLMGARREAEKILRELQERTGQEYVSPIHVATVFLGLGKKDQALAWLERAYKERNIWLNSTAADFRFDGLRSDPGFTALLKRLGFTVKAPLQLR